MRGLATALYVLLSAQALACALYILATIRSQPLVERLALDQYAEVFGKLNGAVVFTSYVGRAQAVLLAVTAVTWVRWLYRARLNVAGWGARQRLAPGWAVGGWFVPVANLVIPAVVTYDVAVASEAAAADRRRAPAQGTSGPLAIAWAIAFGLTVVLWPVQRSVAPELPATASVGDGDLAALLDEASAYETLTIVTQGFTLLTIGVAVALVFSVTRRQTARIERRDLSPAG